MLSANASFDPAGRTYANVPPLVSYIAAQIEHDLLRVLAAHHRRLVNSRQLAKCTHVDIWCVLAGVTSKRRTLSRSRIIAGRKLLHRQLLQHNDQILFKVNTGSLYVMGISLYTRMYPPHEYIIISTSRSRSRGRSYRTATRYTYVFE